MADATATVSQSIVETTVPQPSAPRMVKHPFWSQFWRRFRRHRLALAGAVILVAFYTLTIAAPVIAPYDRDAIDLQNINAAPSIHHWCGTDEVGRDVLTRLLYGGRVSLFLGFVVMAISVVLGAVLGALSGYYGGWVDIVIMRLVDGMQTIPLLLVLMVLAKIMKGNLLGLAFIIGVVSWPGLAMLVRGSFLSLREKEFVEAARAAGAGDRAIIFRHILPNTMAPIIVSATLTVAGAIAIESILSFLGLGIQAPVPSWGNMLQNAQDFIFTNPSMAFYPGFLILVTILCFNFVGDGLRDALDPKLSLT